MKKDKTLTLSRYAVIGNPIAHSLSPKIHQLFAKQFNIPLIYEKIESTTENFEHNLNTFFKTGGHGLNITYPFKQIAIEYANTLSPIAKASGNINMLTQDQNGNLHGDNSDGLGFWRALACIDKDFNRQTILILGNGNVARSILAARPENFKGKIVISSRQQNDQFQEKIDWLIDTRPAHIEAIIPFQYSKYMTVNYSEKQSTFYDGRAMLIEQAAIAFEQWHQRQPDLNPVYQALTGTAW